MLRFLLIWSFALLLVPVSLFAQSKKVIVYYDDARKMVKEEYFVEDTVSMLLDGPYRAYYTSGTIKEKGLYRQNEATGYWEYFYENGQPKMRGELRNGSNFGHWEYFFENGNLSMEGSIFDGMRQEEWTHYYENGSIKHKGKYLNNRKVGIWNYFYEGQDGRLGPLKAQAFYQDGRGTYKEFYPNGNLKTEGLYVDGKSEGEWLFYHPTGELEAKGKYEGGLRTGIWYYYHPNGIMAAEGAFEKGLRNGNWTFYHENGNLSSEGNMQEGKKDGYWKLFNRWGEYKGEGNFVKGEGEYKEFHENGRLKTIGMVRDDLNQGEWLYYYDDGRLEGRADFTDGVGYYTGYYPDGTINMEGQIANGQRVGIWKMYKRSGELSGFYKVYYENSKPVYKIIDEDNRNTVSEGSDKPEYRFKVKSFRNFKPQINEFKAIILAANPLAPLAGSFPVSVEYYFQERLGYEVQLSYLRDPFFRNHARLGIGEEYSQGISLAVRQKLYQPEKALGMFYYGHELRLSPRIHYHNTGNATLGQDGTISMGETRLEYSIVVGNRLTQDAGRHGITLDVFVGLGAGYRFINKHYRDDELENPAFTELNKSSFTTPVRFGLNLGYAFGHRKRNGKN